MTKAAIKSNSAKIVAALTAAPANSETITNTAPAPTVVTVVTKADKARVVLAESYSDMAKIPARKDIIGRLVAEAELTPAGAATYLQNYKTKHGLTQKALAAKAEPATA
jgi:hypothetical protein